MKKKRGARVGGRRVKERTGKGSKRNIKMCYVCVPIPQDECNHYVLKTGKT